MSTPRSISYRLHWNDLTDEERAHWKARGMCPYDRSQDPTAEDMRPVYEARGYKRQPNTVRGDWDDLTDEEYDRQFNRIGGPNGPENLVWSLQRSGTDGICVHPETLQAAAKIAVKYQREREAGLIRKPEPAPLPAPELPAPKLPKRAPLGWDPGKPYSPAMLVVVLMEKARGRCGICGKLIRAATGPMRASADHIIAAGPHAMSNLQAAHLRCNVLKGAR